MYNKINDMPKNWSKDNRKQYKRWISYCRTHPYDSLWILSNYVKYEYDKEYYNRLKINSILHSKTYRILKYNQINDMPRGWVKENIIHEKIHDMWWDMFKRVFDDSYPEHEYYKDCIICIDWYWLSNYAKFIEDSANYQIFCETCNHTCWSVDKDLIKDGNRIYSPEYCTLMTMQDNKKERDSRYSKYIIAIKSDKVILFPQKGYKYLENYGLTPSGITNCLKHKVSTYKGYKWYYINYKHNLRLRKVH